MREVVEVVERERKVSERFQVGDLFAERVEDVVRKVQSLDVGHLEERGGELGEAVGLEGQVEEVGELSNLLRKLADQVPRQVEPSEVSELADLVGNSLDQVVGKIELLETGEGGTLDRERSYFVGLEVESLETREAADGVRNLLDLVARKVCFEEAVEVAELVWEVGDKVVGEGDVLKRVHLEELLGQRVELVLRTLEPFQRSEGGQSVESGELVFDENEPLQRGSFHPVHRTDSVEADVQVGEGGASQGSVLVYLGDVVAVQQKSFEILEVRDGGGNGGKVVGGQVQLREPLQLSHLSGQRLELVGPKHQASEGGHVRERRGKLFKVVHEQIHRLELLERGKLFWQRRQPIFGDV